jgi:hypothetical protein
MTACLRRATPSAPSRPGDHGWSRRWAIGGFAVDACSPSKVATPRSPRCYLRLWPNKEVRLHSTIYNDLHLIFEFGFGALGNREPMLALHSKSSTFQSGKLGGGLVARSPHANHLGFSSGKRNEEPIRSLASVYLGLASGHMNSQQFGQQRGDLIPRSGRAHGVAIQINGLDSHRPSRPRRKTHAAVLFFLLCKANGHGFAIDSGARQNIPAPDRNAACIYQLSHNDSFAGRSTTGVV